MSRYTIYKAIGPALDKVNAAIAKANYQVNMSATNGSGGYRISFIDIPITTPEETAHICGVAMHIDKNDEIDNFIWYIKPTVYSGQFLFIDMENPAGSEDQTNWNWQLFSYAACCYFHDNERFPSSLQMSQLHPDYKIK